MSLSPSILWRQRTPGGIPYRLIDRSGLFSNEEGNVTEVIALDSSRLVDLVNEGFPYPDIIGGRLVYPGKPVFFGTGLTVNSISFESFTEGRPNDPFGFDPLALVGTYDPFLKVTIEYGPGIENDQPKDDDNPETFLQITANAAGVYWAVSNSPNSQWVEPGGNEDVEEVNLPNTVIEPNVEWTVRWTQIDHTFFSNPVMGRLRNKLGKVNSEIMPLLKDAPPETILFLTWSMSQQLTWRTDRTGRPPLQLEMKFMEKNFKSIVGGVDVNHQFRYRPKTGDWRKLLINGNPLFADTDLNEIWE